MVLRKWRLFILGLVVFSFSLLISPLFFNSQLIPPSIPLSELENIQHLSQNVNRFIDQKETIKNPSIQELIDAEEKNPFHLAYLDWQIKLSKNNQPRPSFQHSFFHHMDEEVFSVAVPVGSDWVRGVLMAQGKVTPAQSYVPWGSRVLFSLAMALLAMASVIWLKAQTLIRPIDQLCQQFTKYRREQEHIDIKLPEYTKQPALQRRLDILKDLWERFQSTQSQLGLKVDELEQSKKELEKTIHDLELAKAQERRLVELGHALAEFGHDIQNANGSILAFVGLTLQILEQESITMVDLARCPLYVKNIQIASESITGLTTDILEFSKGKTDLQIEFHAVEEFIAKLKINFGFVRDLPIEYEIDSLQNMALRLDAGKLIRVIVNLVKNAWEKLENAEQLDGMIQIRFLADHQNGLHISVRDNGSPIPNAIIPKLFQSFETQGKDRGTGLGLSICKKIVQAHRGQICAENLPHDEGVQFTLSLPHCVVPLENTQGAQPELVEYE